MTFMGIRHDCRDSTQPQSLPCGIGQGWLSVSFQFLRIGRVQHFPTADRHRCRPTSCYFPVLQELTCRSASLLAAVPEWERPTDAIHFLPFSSESPCPTTSPVRHLFPWWRSTPGRQPTSNGSGHRRRSAPPFPHRLPVGLVPPGPYQFLTADWQHCPATTLFPRCSSTPDLNRPQPPGGIGVPAGNDAF